MSGDRATFQKEYRRGILKLDELSYEEIVRLADDLKPWPKEAIEQAEHIHPHFQVQTQTYSFLEVKDKGGADIGYALSWQDTGFKLLSGGLLQCYTGTGTWSPDSNNHHYTAYGINTYDQSYVFPPPNTNFTADAHNAYCVVLKSNGQVFGNYEVSVHGIPGLATQYYPDFKGSFLLNGHDEGPLYTAVNDDENSRGDNVADGGGPVSFTISMLHGSAFFKHLALTRKR